MACDGTIHFAIQEFLNARTNLAVGSAPRTCVARSLDDRGHTSEQLRPDGRADCRFQRRPRDTRVLSTRSRSTRGEPDARSLLSKKNGPPGCTLRLTLTLHVSGSACDVSARMVVVGSMNTSDIFHNPAFAAFTEGPQVLERVDPRAVTVVPADGDGVVAHAGDRGGGLRPVARSLDPGEGARSSLRHRRPIGTPIGGPGRRSRSAGRPPRARTACECRAGGSQSPSFASPMVGWHSQPSEARPCRFPRSTQTALAP